MADGDARDLAAGDFSAWLADARRAIRGTGDSAVPCGTCTACCTSSQFVHIAPDETATLARIPPALLFPAPGRPRGHVLLGYDERGRCPMLVGERCSIYEDRPRTCRRYDCRVFPAAGVAVDDGAQVAIGRQAERWRFDVSTPGARGSHEAVRAAAAYLRAHGELLAEAGVPANATQIAVLAIELHEIFLGGDGTLATPEPSALRAALQRWVRGRA